MRSALVVPCFVAGCAAIVDPSAQHGTDESDSGGSTHAATTAALSNADDDSGSTDATTHGDEGGPSTTSPPDPSASDSGTDDGPPPDPLGLELCTEKTAWMTAGSIYLLDDSIAHDVRAFAADDVAGLDAAVADERGRVLVLSGNGDAELGTPLVLALPEGASPRELAWGDFDGSGANDLLASDAASSTLWLLRQEEPGAWQPAEPIELGLSSYTIAAHDFDLDGHLDFAALVDRDEGSVVAGFGVGNGEFQLGPESGVQSGPREFATGDLDGDGLVDLFGTNTSQGGVLVRRNLGDRYFDNDGALALDDAAEAALAIDLDADGLAEIVVSTGPVEEPRLHVWRGGAIARAPEAIWTLSHLLVDLVAADIDGDGMLELVGTGYDAASGDALVIVRGGLATPCMITLPLDAPAPRFDAGDFDGDGDSDFLLSQGDRLALLEAL